MIWFKLSNHTTSKSSFTQIKPSKWSGLLNLVENNSLKNPWIWVHGIQFISPKRLWSGSKICHLKMCLFRMKIILGWLFLRNRRLRKFFLFSSVQFSSVAQSCPTLCDPMNRSTPGLPVHHQLPEFTQTHVHWVGDAIQPSHPLPSPSPPAPNPSQHQSLLKWVNSSHEVAKVLEFQL